MCKTLKDDTPYRYNDGSSLSGTTWSTPTDDTDDDGGCEPDFSRAPDEDEREL